MALLWHFKVFTRTNGVLILFIHLLTGFSLASWSFLVAAPFGKSPPLAGITSAFLALILAILARISARNFDNVGSFIFTLLFPSSFYIFAIRIVCAFEGLEIGANVVRPDPLTGRRLLPVMIAAIVRYILLFFCMSDSRFLGIDWHFPVAVLGGSARTRHLRSKIPEEAVMGVLAQG